MQINSFFPSKNDISHLYALLEYVFGFLFVCFLSLHTCPAREVTQHGIFQARVLEWGAIAFSEFNPGTNLI